MNIRKCIKDNKFAREMRALFSRNHVKVVVYKPCGAVNRRLTSLYRTILEETPKSGVHHTILATNMTLNIYNNNTFKVQKFITK